MYQCYSAQRASGSPPGATPQVSTVATHFALKGQRRPALRNPVRVRVQTVHQPGAAFIRIRGFSCPRLICASLSGSIAAPTEPSHLPHKYYRALHLSMNRFCTGKLTHAARQFSHSWPRGIFYGDESKSLSKGRLPAPAPASLGKGTFSSDGVKNRPPSASAGFLKSSACPGVVPGVLNVEPPG